MLAEAAIEGGRALTVDSGVEVSSLAGQSVAMSPVVASVGSGLNGKAPAGKSPVPLPTFKPPALAKDLLVRAYTNVVDDTGWALVGQLSSHIHANHPDFDPRTYGCAKFIDLLQKTASFELVQRAYKNGQSYFCRPSKAIPPRVATKGAPATNGKPPFNVALLLAVTEATGSNGWAPVSVIGQKLKAVGLDVRGSGHTTLTKALSAMGKLEMKGSAAERCFRLNRAK